LGQQKTRFPLFSPHKGRAVRKTKKEKRRGPMGRLARGMKKLKRVTIYDR
jgi:hypothetical protein